MPAYTTSSCSGYDKGKSPMARKTEIFRLLVLVMTEVTIGLGIVMAILMRVGRFDICRFLSQLSGIMTLQTLDHGYRFSFISVSMTIRALNILASMELIQENSLLFRRACRVNTARRDSSRKESKRHSRQELIQSFIFHYFSNHKYSAGTVRTVPLFAIFGLVAYSFATCLPVR